MKIEVDLINDVNIKAQLATLSKYIEINSTLTKEEGFLGMYVYELDIKETPKGVGEKVETKKYCPFHISCRKTVGGLYKFKVWSAV